MIKTPKFLLVASMALLTSASSCDKKVKPAFEQIDSCKVCGLSFSGKLENEKVKLTYLAETQMWYLKNDKFTALLPCKFPKELLIEGKEFVLDGKFEDVENRSLVTVRICIEKIY
jgi:hypothetical protein